MRKLGIAAVRSWGARPRDYSLVISVRNVFFGSLIWFSLQLQRDQVGVAKCEVVQRRSPPIATEHARPVEDRG